MRLLIINTLPKVHPLAEKSICCLTEKASECMTFYTEDMRITPCIGCNACWLKIPGICAVKDDYEQILKTYLQYDVTLFISDTALGFIDYKAGAAGLWVWRDVYQRRYVRSQSVGKENGN